MSGYANGDRKYRNLVVDVDEVMSKLRTAVVEDIARKELKSLPGSMIVSLSGSATVGILDVQKMRSIRQAEVGSTRVMLERVQDKFDLNPQWLIVDTPYGSDAVLG